MNGATRSEHSRSVTSCNSKRDPLKQPLGFSPLAGALADTVAQLSNELEARRAQHASCLHCERFEPVPLPYRGVFCSFKMLLLRGSRSCLPGAIHQVGCGESIHACCIPTQAPTTTEGKGRETIRSPTVRPVQCPVQLAPTTMACSLPQGHA